MGPSFVSLVPQLVLSLEKRGLVVDQFGKRITPEFFLHQKCLIAYNTAKKYFRNEVEPDRLDWNVFWKIYRGLKANGITILEGKKERPIELRDVVEIIEDK